MQAVTLHGALQGFFEVPQEHLEAVGSYFRAETLERGDFWLRTGDPVRKLAFQEGGLLRVYADVEEREVTQWVSMPGYFVTDVAGFYRQKPSRWYIQALTPVRLWTISQDDYLKLDAALPAWRGMERMFMVKCFEMMEDRIFRHLHLTAEQRYHALMAFAPELVNEVPLGYLASMLGMTQETLSRVRAKR